MSSSDASRFFIANGGYGECGICLVQWKVPLETIPCRHIYCAKCLSGLKECPECQSTIDGVQNPNPVILALQMHRKGKCSVCGWEGSYEAFLDEHRTCKRRSLAEDVGTSGSGVVDQSKVVFEYCRGAPLANEFVAHDRRGEVSLPSRQGVSTWVDSTTYVANDFSRNSSAIVRSKGVARWRENISCTAVDYGLTEEEFTFLKDDWLSFATLNPENNNPELRWHDACRLLRFMNFPSHPYDVLDLFQTAKQLIETGGVPFHVFCLWASVNRRDAKKWYDMDPTSYNYLVKYAQLLDVAKTGLFGEEQCRRIGEQMLQRDFTPSQWSSISLIIAEKAKDFPQTMPSDLQTIVTNAQRIQLTLHEIILLFNKYFDTKKKSDLAREEEKKCPPALRERISCLLQHYRPEAAASLDDTLKDFIGQEQQFLESLVQIYGPEPIKKN